mgnify:CR=1 FL=1
MTNANQPVFVKQGFSGLLNELMVQGVASVKSKFLFIISPLVLVLLASGCAISHNYEWSKYPIKSERVTQTINFQLI